MRLTTSTEGAVVFLRIPLPESLGKHGQTLVVDMPPKEARELAWGLLKAAAAATWAIVRGVL